MTFLVTSAQLHIELTANSSRAVLLVTRTATVHSFPAGHLQRQCAVTSSRANNGPSHIKAAQEICLPDI